MAENIESRFRNSSICWFCEKNPADLTLAIKYHLEKNKIVGRTTHSVNFQIQKRTIEVPQCQRCKELRDKGNTFSLIPTLSFFILGGLFYYLLSTFTSVGELGSCSGFIAAFIIALALQVLISNRMEKKAGWTEEEKQIIAKNPDNFQELKLLQEAGWLDPDAANKQRRSS